VFVEKKERERCFGMGGPRDAKGGAQCFGGMCIFWRLGVTGTTTKDDALFPRERLMSHRLLYFNQQPPRKWQFDVFPIQICKFFFNHMHVAVEMKYLTIAIE
jgi:hypothetical protein